MSHFSLIVALPPGSNVQEELDKRLAPYDENTQVEAYPDYEDSAAADYWWYNSLKKDAEIVATNDHSKILPYDPTHIGFSSSTSSNKTADEQWADFVRDAEVYNSLPNPVTWEALVVAHNDYYCDGHPYTGESRLYYEAETDRAYTLSTYNPKSKWDYWRIGGRWARYFPTTDKNYWDPDLVPASLSWEWRDVPVDELPPFDNVDGGPKRVLDLEKLRNTKVAEASKEWDDFWEFAKDYPKARSWTDLVDETDAVDPKERQAAIDRCRQVYRAQPLVQAMNEHEKYRRFWGHGPLEMYVGSKDEYLAKVRRDAVPGYALFTLDEEWVAPGEMGWFGLSSDDEASQKAYKEYANEYIDGLADDVILVVLDLHI